MAFRLYTYESRFRAAFVVLISPEISTPKKTFQDAECYYAI